MERQVKYMNSFSLAITWPPNSGILACLPRDCSATVCQTPVMEEECIHRPDGENLRAIVLTDSRLPQLAVVSTTQSCSLTAVVSTFQKTTFTLRMDFTFLQVFSLYYRSATSYAYM